MKNLYLPGLGKTCSKCKIEKPLDDFYNSRSCKDGKHPSCKKCKKLSDRKSYLKNRDVKLKRQHGYNDRNRNKINARQRLYTKIHNKVLREQDTKRRQGLCSSTLLFDKLLICDSPMMFEGFITVKCKQCGCRIVPTYSQVTDRIRGYTNKIAKRGEGNFYCSDDCKDKCPVFRFQTGKQTDPRSSQYVKYAGSKRIRSCQTNVIKQLQCDDVGYNYCEKISLVIYFYASVVILNYMVSVVKYTGSWRQLAQNARFVTGVQDLP